MAIFSRKSNFKPAGRTMTPEEAMVAIGAPSGFPGSVMAARTLYDAYAAPQPQPAPAPPVLALVEAQSEGIDLDGYEEVAREIGLVVPELAKEKLLAYMKKIGMPCWTVESVNEFLNSKLPDRHFIEDHKIVVWKGLRRQDCKREGSWHLTNGQRWVNRVKEVYTSRVPYFAIRLVKSIETEFPVEYDFHVSDYEDVRPDPFLMATPTGQHREAIVIAHWDEPGFHEEPVK